MADQRQELVPAPTTTWFYDPRIRSMLTQVVLVGLLSLLVYEFISNATSNLERQGIASGLGFLDRSAGFGIPKTLGTWLLGYSERSSFGDVFWVGLANTVLVAGCGVVLATVLGFVVGVARLSPNWIIAKLATVYVETLRNIPLLLQIFIWYKVMLQPLPGVRHSLSYFGDSVFVNIRGVFLPRPIFEAGAELMFYGLVVAVLSAIALRIWAARRQAQTGAQFPVLWVSLGLIIGLPLLAAMVTGFPYSFEYSHVRGLGMRGGIVIVPEFIALTLALSTYTASFIAEIVRAGILAVSHGQSEAAGALGLRRGPTLRLIVIPQALKVIIPPLTNQYLNLTKNSSLAMAIAYPDLVAVFAGTTLNQTGQALEIIAMTMMVYLTLSIITSIAMNWYNARWAMIER